MMTFDIRHPDVMDFIKAKREDGRLRQFNLSLLITEDFMNAVKNNEDWDLYFPMSKKEVAHEDEIVYKPWGIDSLKYTYNKDGLVACKVYKTIKAKNLWDMIMTSTYDFAEPGFILVDEVNKMNNNWFCENIRASNPCGEQMLPPYGSCLLGSINLTKFVKNPFTDEAEFDWEAYNDNIAVFTRMLDNVVEINGLPLPEQREEIINKRRHGMGYLGLGSALTMMKIKYGSPASVTFTEEITKRMALVGYKVGMELAEEKGEAPILEQDFVITEAIHDEMTNRGYFEYYYGKNADLSKCEEVIGSTIKGRYLWLFSNYMLRIKEENRDLWLSLEEIGCRFTHHTSIAPTGTIALSIGNNVSNGIEPSFAHHYARNVIREGKKSKEKVDVFSYELLAYKELVNKKAMPYSEEEDENLPDYFVSSENIPARDHVDIQAAAQRWTDSSISKTINVPTEYKYDDFKDIYMYAYDKGLKGCTTFRYNPENFQGVLVKESDLENTIYKFTLEDGSTKEFKGNDIITYDGEDHTAANLYDAIKEGYYGKF